MVRWIGAPPALPLIVRPGSAHRSEHVAAHDPGAEILERACREVVVDAGRPAISPQDVPLEDAGWKEPLVQVFAAAAERLVMALVGADTVNAFTRSLDTGISLTVAAWNS
jgi:hypothetical protein